MTALSLAFSFFSLFLCFVLVLVVVHFLSNFIISKFIVLSSEFWAISYPVCLPFSMCWCVSVFILCTCQWKSEWMFEWMQCKCFHCAVCRHPKSSVWWLMADAYADGTFILQRPTISIFRKHFHIQRLSILWLYRIFILAIPILGILHFPYTKIHIIMQNVMEDRVTCYTFCESQFSYDLKTSISCDGNRYSVGGVLFYQNDKWIFSLIFLSNFLFFNFPCLFFSHLCSVLNHFDFVISHLLNATLFWIALKNN